MTRVTNKHLLPMGKYPMIYHGIYKLKEAGIDTILVVSGKEHMGDVVNLLGSGRHLGVNLTYQVQDEAGGIAQAISLAEGFISGERMAVLLGDNIFNGSILPALKSYEHQGEGAKLLLHEVNDPTRFGVAALSEGKIISIEEKPLTPKSQYAVTGIYFYDSTVFEIIKSLKPSKRGELEVTDINNAYIANGTLTYDILHGWWTDAGTHESYAAANKLAENIQLDGELSS